MEVMTNGGVYGVMLAAPRNAGQKFRDDYAVLGSLDMLSVCPETEIISTLNLLVGTLKNRNLVLQSLVSAGVFYIVFIALLIRFVEDVYVMLQDIHYLCLFLSFKTYVSGKRSLPFR